MVLKVNKMADSKKCSQACHINYARRYIITAQISALRKYVKSNVELSASAAAAASAVPVPLHSLSDLEKLEVLITISRPQMLADRGPEEQGQI